MGRRRKIKLSDIHVHYLKCDCGEEIEVFDREVTKVKCVYCAMGMRPIPDNYDEDIKSYMAEEKVHAVIGKTKRGRPAKVVVAEIVDAATGVAVKRKRGRPSKKGISMDNVDAVVGEVAVVAENVPVVEKVKAKRGAKKSEKKVTTVKGKRGRKATVGAKVLSFINEKKSNVMFDEILTVYSAEREALGKKGTPEIEKRNCLSTLYILSRDSKIKMVQPKMIYSAL